MSCCDIKLGVTFSEWKDLFHLTLGTEHFSAAVVSHWTFAEIHFGFQNDCCDAEHQYNKL